MADTARELFEHELRDIYDAEHKLLNALETMANKVEDGDLQKSFVQHREVTDRQRERLEQVFKLIDRAPRREACEGINGLIKEFSKFTQEENPAPEVLNVFAAAAALKVEHYEMTAYKSLIKLAGQLGFSEAAVLLEENLAEEQEAATELEQMADVLGPRMKADA